MQWTRQMHKIVTTLNVETLPYRLLNQLPQLLFKTVFDALDAVEYTIQGNVESIGKPTTNINDSYTDAGDSVAA